MAPKALRLLNKTDAPSLAGLPKLADVLPEYAATIAKTIELRDEHAAVTRQIGELGKQMQGTTGPDAFVVAQAEHRRREALRGILGDSGPSAAPPPSSDAERLRTLHKRRDELAQAAEYLDEKTRRLRIDASRKLCEQIGPRYAEIVTDVSSKLAELANAYSQYMALTRALTADGVLWGGGMSPFALSFLEDGAQSDGGQLLRDAVKEGYLKAADIPEDFRIK